MEKETRDLYHLTTKENLESILKDGLKCTIGEHSTFAKEKEPFIYLCDYEDILYWSIILGRDVVVKIPHEIVDLTYINYNNYNNLYSEYVYNKNIDSEYITQIELPEYNQKCMDILCEDFINTLNRICEHSAMIFTEDYKYYNKGDLLQGTLQELNAFLYICNNLNYKSVDQNRLKKYIEDLGVEQCDFTFCDKYNNTEKRLWEQLIEYDCDKELKEKFKQIYDYIKINLDGCNQVETGGWC